MSVAGASAPSSPSSRQSRAGPLWGNSPLKRGAGLRAQCHQPPCPRLAGAHQLLLVLRTPSRHAPVNVQCRSAGGLPKNGHQEPADFAAFSFGRSLWWLLSIVMCNHRAPAFAPSRYIVHYHMYVISVPVGVPMQQRGRAKRVRIGYSVGYQPQVCEAIQHSRGANMDGPDDSRRHPPDLAESRKSRAPVVATPPPHLRTS